MKTKNKNQPTTWRTVKLREAVENIIDNRGRTPPIKKSGHEVLEVNAIISNWKSPDYSKAKKYVSEETYNNWFRSGHPVTGDILIPTVGTIGNVAILKEDRGAIAQNLIALQIKNTCSSDYVYYYLKSPVGRQSILNLDIGGVQPSVKVPHLLGIALPLPPLPEQKAIVEVLSALDDKVELLRGQNKTLEQIGQTVFHRWFVEDAGETILAKDVLDFKRGVEVGSSNYLEKQQEGVAPFYRVADIKDINTANNKTFVRIELLKDGTFSNNDILVSFDGTVGRVFIGGKGGYSSGIRKLVAKEEFDFYSKSFIYFWAKSSLVQETIKSHAIGTTILHAGRSIEFLKIQSDKNLIEKFNKVSLPLFEKIILNIQQIKTLEQVRDTLLPKLMSGEARVKGFGG